MSEYQIEQMSGYKSPDETLPDVEKLHNEIDKFKVSNLLLINYSKFRMHLTKRNNSIP